MNNYTESLLGNASVVVSVKKNPDLLFQLI